MMASFQDTQHAAFSRQFGSRIEAHVTFCTGLGGTTQLCTGAHAAHTVVSHIQIVDSAPAHYDMLAGLFFQTAGRSLALLLACLLANGFEGAHP